MFVDVIFKCWNCLLSVLVIKKNQKKCFFKNTFIKWNSVMIFMNYCRHFKHAFIFCSLCILHLTHVAISTRWRNWFTSICSNEIWSFISKYCLTLYKYIYIDIKCTDSKYIITKTFRKKKYLFLLFCNLNTML